MGPSARKHQIKIRLNDGELRRLVKMKKLLELSSASVFRLLLKAEIDRRKGAGA